jgi:hypothetical protein
MKYSKVFWLCGALLAIHVLLHGSQLLAAWFLVGVSGAFWWKDARFFRTVLASEVAIGLGYYLLMNNSPQLLWLNHNSALPAYAWLALVIGFNVVSCCICVAVPYAVTNRVRSLRSKETPVKEPVYALSH